MEKRIQIYTADAEKICSVPAHKFIAEFADEKITKCYIDYLFKKNQGRHKAIIAKEYTLAERPQAELVEVIAETGESLPVDEYEIVD